MQALQAAEKKSHRFRRRRSEGTIEVGKNANLLILDANPLDDIRNTEKIRALVIHGKVLDRVMLDHLLKNEGAFAAQQGTP
jgi:imidazolonepropionase-like amidohydrolase